ncbi:MAG: hypothetical protein HY817_04245 [Candidatus Abawacabacteria bacterium]|nr:hypothetical protein [Candidatus Abawacabacteria bacterium]
MKTVCINCRNPYEITESDMDFYDKISPVIDGKKYPLPAPTKCPSCRVQRRMAWRNERTLYNRKCDLCKKSIISIFTPEAKHPVYCPTCFVSDKWDATHYGRNFDFSRPFFEQYSELQKVVPMTALHHERENENCEYTNLTSDNKNCYLVFAAGNNEFAFYTTYLQRCRDIADCFFIFDSELCYECIDCYHGYNLLYSHNCQNCSDSQLLFDCKSCKHCFGCVNLTNKEFYIFNQPYTKEEYANKIKELTNSRESFAEARKEVEKIKLALPHKYYSGHNNENFSGDHIFSSKNAFNCFDCNNLEDCSYCTWMTKSKDCQDCYAWGNTGELGYENHLCGNGYHNVKFCDGCSNDISNLMYSECIRNSSHDIFGCISLFRKEYCILNKPYAKEDYFKLLAQIMEHMQRNGEWGQPFPISLSRFAYNETIAQEYAPLSKEAVISLGGRWKEEELKTHYQGKSTAIPYDINEVSDDILKEILSCKTCGKNYRLIAQELNLYRKLKVSVPENCFACRYKNRFNQRNPRKLYERICHSCQIEIQTTYDPQRPETILCETCYLKETH